MRLKRLLKIVLVVGAPIFLWSTFTKTTYPTRNVPFKSSGVTYGFEMRNDGNDDTFVVVTASGGGKRASTLTLGVLQAMQRVELPSRKTLAESINIISGVSGGSVTAAHFALHGPAGLQLLDDKFIKHDSMSALVWSALNPSTLASLAAGSYQRIDLLIDYLDRQLFHAATYERLIQNRRHPYLILNAADMVEGRPFSFTQPYMSLLCSDLTKMKLSTAVAASAAYPVALSPITLKNYSRCEELRPPLWIGAALGTSWYANPQRVGLGRSVEGYVTGRKSYVHLLDGGIADNLGIEEILRTLTTDDISPPIKQYVADGRIKKFLFVVINASSSLSSGLDTSPAAPGMLAMLTAATSSAIDRASVQIMDRLFNVGAFYREVAGDARRAAADRDLPGMPPDIVVQRREALEQMATNLETIRQRMFIVNVDVSAIQDPACRRRFHSIQTSWTLSKTDTDALKVVGEALLAQDPSFGRAMSAMGARLPGGKTIAEACSLASVSAR